MSDPFRPQPDEPGIHRCTETRCPHCRYRINAVDAGNDDVPNDGDWSICFSCTEPAVFVITGGVVSLRAMTAEERAEFDASPFARDRRRLQAYLAQTGRRRG